MPRKLRPPRYALHKGTGQARVRIKGRDIYLGMYDSPESHARYRRLLAEWAANGGQVPPPNLPGKVLTVADLVVRWMDHATQYYSCQETAKARSSLRALVRLYGDTRAEEFGPVALKAIRQALIDGTWLTEEDKARYQKNGKPIGLSRGVVNSRIGLIKRVFKWAVSEELVPPAVHQSLSTVAGLRRGRTNARETSPVKPVPSEDLAKTLPELHSTVRAMVEFQLLTAARPGEVVQLRPVDIDQAALKGNDLAIWVYRPENHKTANRGHRRVILIGPKAQQIVAPFLEGCKPEATIFNPRKAVREVNKEKRRLRKTRVQPSQKNRREKNPKRRPRTAYTPYSYGRAIRRACLRAGVPVWHPHQLRHNAATLLVQQFGWDAARIVLGHRHVSTTQIYAEDDLVKAVQAIAKCG